MVLPYASANGITRQSLDCSGSPRHFDHQNCGRAGGTGTPAKWTYYYLYVMLDIFSRYVVGWLIAERETGALAEVLIAEACAKQRIGRSN